MAGEKEMTESRMRRIETNRRFRAAVREAAQKLSRRKNMKAEKKESESNAGRGRMEQMEKQGTQGEKEMSESRIRRREMNRRFLAALREAEKKLSKRKMMKEEKEEERKDEKTESNTGHGRMEQMEKQGPKMGG